MQCELVQIQTADSVSLEGARFRSKNTTPAAFDAAVILHGLAGNFYSSRLLSSLTRALLLEGIDVIQANTRGHDTINLTSVSGRVRYLGAAYELVDECRYDVDAWINHLAARNLNRILLIGHSLGAIKSLYSQAYQPHPQVRALVALSASRLNHQAFLQSSSGETFRACLARAQAAIDDNDPGRLIQVDFPFPTLITAEGYLEKYGPADRYDWTRYIRQVSVPLLLLFGEKELETNEAFRGALPLLEQLDLESVQTQVIVGADHFYSGCRQAVCDTVVDWVRQHPARA